MSSVRDYNIILHRLIVCFILLKTQEFLQQCHSCHSFKIEIWTFLSWGWCVCMQSWSMNRIQSLHKSHLYAGTDLQAWICIFYILYVVIIPWEQLPFDQVTDWSLFKQDQTFIIPYIQVHVPVIQLMCWSLDDSPRSRAMPLKLSKRC